jgi:hypothetical protein
VDVAPDVYEIPVGSTATITCELDTVAATDVVWMKDERVVDELDMQAQSIQVKRISDGMHLF